MPVKAFPTAYGGGANATGGRGGNVYHVTNLEETGVGSLSWALSQARPATIVFDVSGYIDSEAWIQISGSDLTIAGQTAPVGGITLAPTGAGRSKYRTQAQPNDGNIIMRYIRIRPAQQSGDDSFEFHADYGLVNVIADHVSVSYGGDETFSVRTGDGADNITFQNCIIAEGKTGSLFGSSGSGERGYSSNFSYLNNLNYNISHRSPNYSMNSRADIINNVNHDWQNGMAAMFGSIQLNHVNNYYNLGSRGALIGSEIEGQEQSGHSADIFDGQNPAIYTAGNISSDGRLNDPLQDNSPLWWKWKETDSIIYDYRQDLLPSQYFVNTMYTQIGEPMPIKTATETKDYVLANAGANASLNSDGTVTRYTDLQDTFYLDIVGDGDSRDFYPYIMYDQVRTWWEWDTAPIKAELNNKYSAFITSDISELMDSTLMYDTFRSDVISQGTTPINTRPANFYVSNPHIPEDFLVAKGLTGTATIHNDIAPSGYTWLEEYLNGVDTASLDGNTVFSLTELEKSISKRSKVLLTKMN